MVDLARRRPANRTGRSASVSWKVAAPLLIALALLAAFSGHKLLRLGFSQTRADAQLQYSRNCTSTTGSNVTCDCLPAADIFDGATSTTVLRLANKVSVATVDKVLDAASSERPAEQTVRVRACCDIYCPMTRPAIQE